MEQLRQRRLTDAGNCYTCEDQHRPVKHLILLEGQAGKMLRGQDDRITYVTLTAIVWVNRVVID